MRLVSCTHAGAARTGVPLNLGALGLLQHGIVLGQHEVGLLQQLRVRTCTHTAYSLLTRRPWQAGERTVRSQSARVHCVERQDANLACMDVMGLAICMVQRWCARPCRCRMHGHVCAGALGASHALSAVHSCWSCIAAATEAFVLCCAAHLVGEEGVGLEEELELEAAGHAVLLKDVLGLDGDRTGQGNANES